MSYPYFIGIPSIEPIKLIFFDFFKKYMFFCFYIYIHIGKNAFYRFYRLQIQCL